WPRWRARYRVSQLRSVTDGQASSTFVPHSPQALGSNASICVAIRGECSFPASGSRQGLAIFPAPSEPDVRVSPHTAQASASMSSVARTINEFCNKIGTKQTHEIPAVFVRFSRHSRQFLVNLRA